MNALIEYNKKVLESTLELKKEVEARRERRGYISYAEYTLPRLTALLGKVLGEEEVDIQGIERKKFGADLCIKLPRKLKELGNTTYMSQVIPVIVEIVKNSSETKDLFSTIEVKGIYVNVKFSDHTLLSFLEEMFLFGSRYGESDLWKKEGIVCDYSSPNLAKTLHAGHIRSTIIGHILCNLYEAVGAYAYRTNHVNDLGGVGYLFEGYKRWSTLLTQSASKGAQLAELYVLFRSLQKVYEAGAPENEYEKISAKVQACFPGVKTPETFKNAFAEYEKKAVAAQEKLEQGDEEVVALWKQFMQWSLGEFEQFYGLLGTHIDFTLGESFYLPEALQIIEKGKEEGKVVVWNEAHVEAVEKELTQRRDEGSITPQVHDSLLERAKQDIGATVIPLSSFDRVVALRADGVSIYTTRDLQAVKFRTNTFQAKRLVYEVAVEQNDHFNKLFEAARVLGLCSPETELLHLAHEMYIDSSTKKKLSSRDGATSVEMLLASTIEYFKKKYHADSNFTQEEADKIGKQLGVGSIIFHDIKKDKKYPVEINAEVSKMHEEFERSGGAYVVYAACRARSILKKWGKEIEFSSDFTHEFTLEEPEIEIIKALIEYPRKIADSAKYHTPSILVNYLLDLARSYNSYYAGYPVLKGDEVHLHRLLITKAVQTVIENGLLLCNIQCPERI